MKLNLSKESGGVLLVTLVITTIMGTALASYLKLVEYQNRSVVRSQYWNAAIPAAEAGIEEALAHLNNVGDSNRAVNGWQLQNAFYKINRNLGTDSRFEVSMDGLMQPSITAVGYVKEPITGSELKRTVYVQTTRYGAGMRGIVARRSISMIGNTRVDSFDSGDPNYSTNGRYDANKHRANGYAGAVSGNVYAEGDGVWGYVATGPNGTATGNVGDALWMASNSGIQTGHYLKDLNLSFPEVEVPFNGGGLTPLNNQNVTVTNYTYLNTQVTSTTVPNPIPAGGVTTNNQSVTTVTKPFSWSGTLTTNTASTTSTNYPAQGTYIGNVTTRVVVTGHGKNAVTTTYYDYLAISGYTYNSQTYTYNTVTTNASTTTKNYALVTESGNYQMNAFSLSGQEELLVKGDTVLYITGDMTMTGQGQITILPGASLTIYLGGDAALSGNGVMNLAEDATKYTLYGLPTCTDINLSGNAEFTGVIYAPSADLSLNGSGNTIYDCVGAVVANDAYFNGNFQFHYDEKLGRNAPKPRFKIASWNEI